MPRFHHLFTGSLALAIGAFAACFAPEYTIGVGVGGGVGGAATSSGMGGAQGSGGAATSSSSSSGSTSSSSTSSSASGACGACDGGTSPPPAGWKYVTFAVNPQVGTPCPPGFADPKTFGQNLTDPGCESCAVGAWSGGVCGIHATGYGNSNCTGATVFDETVGSGVCISTTGAAGVDFEGALTSAGTCDSTSTPKAASYQDLVTVCDAVIDACACVPTAGAPFSAARCVLADASGDQVCPPGYPSRLDVGQGVADSRTCTCNVAPSGVTCAVQGAVGVPASCIGGGPGTFWSFGCAAASPAFGIVLSVGATGGSCPAGGPPQAGGVLGPGKLRVVCCG